MTNTDTCREEKSTHKQYHKEKQSLEESWFYNPAMKKINVLHAITTSIDTLRPSERKVAEYVINNAHKVTTMRIVDLASEADVSEPTVIRFCRSLGLDGFQKFKISLAQSLAVSPIFDQFKIHYQDSTKTSAEKVFDSTINSLLTIRNILDTKEMSRAVAALSSAERVEFYGYGTSAAIATDAQHKFFRLLYSCASHCDPHAQSMSATTLKKGDVVVAFSQSGRTRNMLHSINIARQSKATTIAICPGNTPLAQHCDICLAVDIMESSDMFSTMTSRIVQLTVMDALTVSVAMRRNKQIEPMLERIKNSQKTLYIDD